VNITLANLEALAAGLGCAEHELLLKFTTRRTVAHAVTQGERAPTSLGLGGIAQTGK
jgi:hypothetical protein